MNNYHLVDRRPCLLEENGDPLTIPTPPEWRPLTDSHSITTNLEPPPVPLWCIVGIIIGLLAIVVGLLEVFFS